MVQNTTFTVYLFQNLDDEKFPENYEEMQWFIACIPSPSNMCSTTLPVAIRNCGRYNEYFLNQPQSCDVAYCFSKLKYIFIFKNDAYMY